MSQTLAKDYFYMLELSNTDNSGSICVVAYPIKSSPDQIIGPTLHRNTTS